MSAKLNKKKGTSGDDEWYRMMMGEDLKGNRKCRKIAKRPDNMNKIKRLRYQEFVATLDAKIAKVDGDIKKKVMVEITRDKILQLRLQQRMSGAI